MRPILIRIGDIGIPSYGLMLVLSFILALLLVKRSAKRFNIAPGIIENLTFWLMLGAIIGGRLLYVLFHWHDYQDIFSILKIWEGGMMFFGSFIGAFASGMIYLRKEQLPILLLADLISPTIGLGEFFTRIGCFLNGCCFGMPSTLAWAIKFPQHSIAGSSAIGDNALHPTQLYSSLFGLLLFLFLQKMVFKKHYRGELFALYLVLSGLFRFSIDFIRFYENLANLLVNQVISILVVIAGVVLLIVSRRAKITDAG